MNKFPDQINSVLNTIYKIIIFGIISIVVIIALFII